VVWDPELDLEKGNLYRIFGKERTYDKLGEIQISDADHVDLLCVACWFVLRIAQFVH